MSKLKFLHILVTKIKERLDKLHRIANNHKIEIMFNL